MTTLPAYTAVAPSYNGRVEHLHLTLLTFDALPLHPTTPTGWFNYRTALLTYRWFVTLVAGVKAQVVVRGYDHVYSPLPHPFATHTSLAKRSPTTSSVHATLRALRYLPHLPLG